MRLIELHFRVFPNKKQAKVERCEDMLYFMKFVRSVRVQVSLAS